MSTDPGTGPDTAPVLSRIEERADGRVAHLTLNRPQARNAITVALAGALHAALVAAAAEADVVVVRGAGGHFCAGGDFHEVSRLREDGPEALRPLFETFVGACQLIADLPVPVVAAVEGYAMAGGFELVQSVDIALVREDAVLADNHANFGMIPGGGGSQRLPRIVGTPRALGHILLGDRLSGRDAVDWGSPTPAPRPTGSRPSSRTPSSICSARTPARWPGSSSSCAAGWTARWATACPPRPPPPSPTWTGNGPVRASAASPEGHARDRHRPAGPVRPRRGRRRPAATQPPRAASGMNVPFLRALYDAVMTATGQAGLRVLLLTGEGPHFCAGGDVKTFAAEGEALPDYLREATAWLQNVAQAPLALPVPVVTAVHGFAAGGGDWAWCAPPTSCSPENRRSSCRAPHGSPWHPTRARR